MRVKDAAATDRRSGRDQVLHSPSFTRPLFWCAAAMRKLEDRSRLQKKGPPFHHERYSRAKESNPQLPGKQQVWGGGREEEIGRQHHHHLSLNRQGRWGTTDDYATSFLHFSLFSTALWDLPNSRPVHSLMFCHLFLCLPCRLPPFTVPCKMVLVRPDERET